MRKRVIKATPGHVVDGRFVPGRHNPGAPGITDILTYPISLATPAGVDKRGHTKKNPKGGKFDRCVKAVSKSGTAASPYAICSKSVGRRNPDEGWQDAQIRLMPDGNMEVLIIEEITA